MTAQMTSQMTPRSATQMTLPLELDTADAAEAAEAPAPIVPSIVPSIDDAPVQSPLAQHAVAYHAVAHAGLVDLLLDPAPVVAPWNRSRPPRPDRVVGAPRSARRRAVTRTSSASRVVVPRHLRLVTDERPVPPVTRRPIRTLCAGLGLAVLVALASLGVVTVLGADAAASTPASSTGATPSVAAAAPAPVAVAEPSAPEWVVVQPGESLWTLARRLQPKGDVRALVDRLAARVGASVMAGQRIDVSGLVG